MSLKIMAELGLDGRGFESGMKRAEGLAHGVAEGLKGFVVQAVGIYTVEQAIAKTVETAKDLVETSKRLSIPIEQLQVMRQAAKESHVEFEKLAEMIEKANIARDKALRPGKEGDSARRAFGAMGVGRDQLTQMAGAQLMLGPMADAARSRNAANLDPIFREILGKGFGPAISLLKTDFDEVRKRMVLMSTETAVKLSILSDEFSYLAQIIAVKLGPVLISFVEFLMKALAGLHGTWTYISTSLTGKGGAAMHATMMATPGFGGYQPGQQKLAAQLKERDGDEEKRNQEAKAAAVGTITKWDKFFAEMEAKFAALAEQLKHPPAPDLGGSMLPTKGMKIPSDALVKVGNFLGSNMSGMTQSINERKLRHLAAIEEHTRNLAHGQGSRPLSHFLTGSFIPHA